MRNLGCNSGVYFYLFSVWTQTIVVVGKNESRLLVPCRLRFNLLQGCYFAIRGYSSIDRERLD